MDLGDTIITYTIDFIAHHYTTNSLLATGILIKLLPQKIAVNIYVFSILTAVVLKCFAVLYNTKKQR